MSLTNDFFIEEEIHGRFFRLLDDQMGYLLEEMALKVPPLKELEMKVPPLEVGGRPGRDAVYPDVYITECERTEKERIILTDAYSVLITFPVPESEDGDLYCYAYASAFEKTLDLNPTLEGIASRAVLTGKKYIRPKKPHYGEGWKLILSVRVTVENKHSC
jgi:hypothetical protein